MSVSTPLYWVDGSQSSFVLGQFFCVGRNYAEHAKELGNPIPQAPILFTKPTSAYQAIRRGVENHIQIPARESCHHELELALLIGEPIGPQRNATDKLADDKRLLGAVVGIGLALDLTLRDVQVELKSKGHPWERAKGFAGSCPLTEFLPLRPTDDCNGFRFQMLRNGVLQQTGCAEDMIFSIASLLRELGSVFQLQPGDVVLTGTPAGVGPLLHGDRLELALWPSASESFSWSLRVDNSAY